MFLERFSNPICRYDRYYNSSAKFTRQHSNISCLKPNGSYL